VSSNAIRIRSVADQPPDAMRDRVRLAGARTRDDEERRVRPGAAEGDDGLLRIVERRKGIREPSGMAPSLSNVRSA
jgi:hypothetical protein